MEWGNPEAFYLILPLSFGWLALSLYSRSRRRRAMAAFVSAAMLPRIMPSESSTRFWTKVVFWELALIFGLLALARPRFGTYYEEIRPRGSDIYVLIDVSKSMLASDVPPNRLARAKSDVSSLLNRLKGERVGLIAFAGVAVVKCPLTNDYGFYRLALNELNPGSVPRGGTAIGDAVRKALEVMPAVAERDQVILLITDGDDQNSYPLDAAIVAAERHVAIFSIGLGDADQGTKIPLKAGVENVANDFVSYDGKPVVSKMDEKLLSEMALRTQGVYVPARTRPYDLGQLYKDHLERLRGSTGTEKKRVRLSEQYQLFLALAIFCLLIEFLTGLYSPRRDEGALASMKISSRNKKSANPQSPPLDPPLQGGESRVAAPLVFICVLLSLAAPNFPVVASEAGELVGEGVSLYNKGDFDGAKDKFTKADEKLKKEDGSNPMIVAFDLACAFHRKGDTEHAREHYLKAGLSRDKPLAATAYFNLGTLMAENARTLAGENPGEIPSDKRQEIIDKLKEAVADFRNCLELQPQHPAARKNIELIWMWLKLYSDKWRDADKRKQREESDLMQFLSFIIESQRALREVVRELKPTESLDRFAEIKQGQEELIDEIEPLKQKMEATLGNVPVPQPTQPGQQPAPQQPDVEKLRTALKMLESWADASCQRMHDAASGLGGRQPEKAVDEQKQAIAELEKIWEAVAPFQLLLKRDLAEQTSIVYTLNPEALKEPEGIGDKVFSWMKNLVAGKQQKSTEETSKPAANPAQSQETPDKKTLSKPALDSQQTAELAQMQKDVSRRTVLLKLKAEAELQELQKQPPVASTPDPKPVPDPNQPATPAQPDPEKVKAGLLKAIELAPKAVEKMNVSDTALQKEKPDDALPSADEARKILEEIQKAQPKQEEQKKDDKDQQKKDQEKKEQEKNKEKKNQPDEKKDKQEKPEKQDLSKEQAEAMLRKVREREQERRKKQEEERARVMGRGNMVDKDW